MGKKKNLLPWSPIRDIMKKKGALIVARDAVDFMRTIVIDLIEAKTEEALKLTRHSKRTKLTKADIELVMKLKA